MEEFDLAVVVRTLEAHGEAPQAGEVAHDFVGAVAERAAAEGGVAQGERAVAAQVDVLVELCEPPTVRASVIVTMCVCEALPPMLALVPQVSACCVP